LIDPDRIASPLAVLVGERRMVGADDGEGPDALLLAAGVAVLEKP
jgi:hypothetical protein